MRRCTLILLFAAAGCCGGRAVVVKQPTVAALPPPGTLRAAVAETDITPPPGLPTFGYSIAGQVSEGYWTRLKARILAFESARGRRLAIVQLDLGASSWLLQRLIAQRLAGDGLGPADVVLLATHTHAGPGAYFGSCSYNAFGAKKSGFDERLVTSMADRIATAASRAFARLVPAVVGVAWTDVPNVSRNRSPDAWRLNFAGPPPYDGVLPRLIVLRIDRREGSHSRPMGMLIVFPIHGTSVGPENRLNHGDLQGVAARVAAARIERDYALGRDFVAAFADGPEGDVSPAWHRQGFPEARRIGDALAGAAVDLFETMDQSLTEVGLDVAYSEISLPDASTSSGALCHDAAIGMATLGGADDGRTWLYRFGFGEPKPGPSRGCQGAKRIAFGPLQRLIVKPEDFPRTAPLHAFRFGNLLTIVTVPGEPTTETGRRIVAAIEPIAKSRVTGVAAHGDEYLEYVTTAEEYRAQDYEGSSTIYGPREEAFFVERLAALTAQLGQPPTPVDMEHVFHPGKPIHAGDSGPCDGDEWHPIETRIARDATGAIASVTFAWRGMAPGHLCDPLPTISIESQGRTLIGPSGQPEDDHWLNFEVRRGGKRWEATWFAPPRVQSSGECRIRVDRPNLPPLLSDPFKP